MKNITLCTLLVLLISFRAAGQKENEKPAPSFSLNVNYDNMFGFYPGIYGSFGVKENLSFTYYGLLWTNPSFGTPSSGTDNWLETGFGLQVSLGKGKWLLNPTLAFTHGKLLSGGADGVIGDGIAPGMNVLFSNGIMELEAFGTWYKALREEGFFTYDYVLYRLLPGFVINEHISAGLHFEGFSLTRITDGDSEALYKAVGAYAKFTVGEKYTFCLSMGKNFQDSDFPDEFYRLSVAMPFL